MQNLNVIRGPMKSGKTTTLRRPAKARGQEDRIIHAHTFTVAELEQVVIERARRGATAVFLNDCSELQLAKLEKLAIRLGNRVQIHAVVAA